MVLIDSTAAVEAVVRAAKFLRLVSTMVSTGTTGNLNSPAILVKSKSANGFLKAPLAYMGKSPEVTGKAETRLRRFCCGAQRRSIYVCAAASQGTILCAAQNIHAARETVYFSKSCAHLSAIFSRPSRAAMVLERSVVSSRSKTRETA